jgi:hypothetical protein
MLYIYIYVSYAKCDSFLCKYFNNRSEHRKTLGPRGVMSHRHLARYRHAESWENPCLERLLVRRHGAGGVLRKSLPSGYVKKLLKMAINSGFSH